MKTWKFEKRAGLILDQQDDPGAGFQLKIASFWPGDLERPSFGTDAESRHCVAHLSDGHAKIARYPIDTPTNALASAMYFVAYGQDSIEKQAHVPIAKGIKNALVVHDLTLPDGFSAHIKEASQSTPDEAFADDRGDLPVTTPAQCTESVAVFDKYASAYAADDRMVVARKLQFAADRHGLDVDLPYASERLSKTASEAIDRRIEVMRPLENHPGRAKYLQEMTKLRTRLSKMSDYRSLVKTAADLEMADRDANMHTQWGGWFPDPVDSLLVPMYEGDVFDQFDKQATIDWSKVDFEGLKGTFDDGVIEKIASDPETIVPSLPHAEQNIITQYAQEQMS
jgi:hypothetical protein